MAEKKKNSTGESKQRSVRNIAKAGFVGPHPRGQYMRYGDYNPSEVHEGTATYRGSTLPDSSVTNRNMFARYVRRGDGGSNRKGFILNGKLYKFTGSASSDAHVPVES